MSEMSEKKKTPKNNNVAESPKQAPTKKHNYLGNTVIK